MSKGKIAFALAATVIGIGAATAQNIPLSAAEARAELFGVRLTGVHEPTGEAWEECIEPSGRTAYLIDGREREGRLEIESDGQACFAYADDGYARRSCFVVLREGQNYRFDEFVTRRVERGVRACGLGGALVEAPARAGAYPG